jgi:predicted dithiol-disulfide oxidoreductase (DUF899 family)
MSLPEVVTPQEWLVARRELLAREKENTRQRDAINADRRRLPMTVVDKDYRFVGPTGEVGLADLFGGCRQLIVQHVMFAPDCEAACPSCTAALDQLAPPLLVLLRNRDTAFAAVSRAPFEKLAALQAMKGWEFGWYSSFGTDFNYDFNVTVDPAVAPPVYNYTELDPDDSGEAGGFSCFLRDGESIYHTYSAYARGAEYVGNAYTLLDLTALGRQELWEEPKGRVTSPHPNEPSFAP